MPTLFQLVTFVILVAIPVSANAELKSEQPATTCQKNKTESVFNSKLEQKFFEAMERRMEKIRLLKPVPKKKAHRQIRLNKPEPILNLGDEPKQQLSLRSFNKLLRESVDSNFHNDPIGAPAWNAMKDAGDLINGNVPELRNRNYPGQILLPKIEPFLYDKRKSIELEFSGQLS